MELNRRRALQAGFGLMASALAQPTLASKGFFADRKLRVGLQLYMLGEAWRDDTERTLQRVARIGYREVELPVLMPGTAKQLRDAADRAGLVIGSVHVPAEPYPEGVPGAGMHTLAGDPKQLAKDLRILGANSVVVPLPPMPNVAQLPGEELPDMLLRSVMLAGGGHWKKLAALFNQRGEALLAEGIHLSYHNHNFEFAPIGDTNGWEILVAETDPKLLSFEFDVAWTAAAGVDPLPLLRRHAGRFRQLHVKDILPSSKPNFRLQVETTEVGSGRLDWKQLLPAAYDAGVRQFYVEQEPPYLMDRFDAIAKSFAYLTTQV